MNIPSNIDFIYIIDDDSDDIEMITEAFLEAKPLLKIESAPDCLTAMKALAAMESLPDLILLDLKLPGIDGQHCFEMLKADAKLSQVQVIILSGHAELKTFEINALKPLAHYQKPSSFSEIRHTAQKILNYEI